MLRRIGRLHILLIILALLAAIIAPALAQGLAAVSCADQAYAGGDFARAAACYETAARLLMWRPGLSEKAGMAYAFAGNWQPALPLFERARQAGVLSADGWDVFGTGYWLQSDNTRALEIWHAGMREFPGEVKFNAREALAYRGLGDFAAERRSLETWVDSGAGSAAEHYRLGQLLMESDADRARGELTAAASLDGEYAPAVEALVGALDLAAPEDNAAKRYIIIGRGLGLVDEWSLAGHAFQIGTQADPANALAWAWLGEAHQHTGQDGSLELDRALSLDPNSTMVHALRGLRDKRRGDYDDALDEFLASAKLDPNNAEWQASVGEAYTLTGDLASALGYYQKATELQPDNAAYWRLLAMFCADNAVQVLEIGLPAAKKAAELAPEDPQALETLGWSYAQAGLLYNAEQMLIKASKLAPGSALAHLHLGETYLRRGDRAAARQEIEAARQLDLDGPIAALAGQLLQQYFP